MVFSELYKIMVNNVTVLGFRGKMAPIAPSPPLVTKQMYCNGEGLNQQLKTCEHSGCVGRGWQLASSRYLVVIVVHRWRYT